VVTEGVIRFDVSKYTEVFLPLAVLHGMVGQENYS